MSKKQIKYVDGDLSITRSIGAEDHIRVEIKVGTRLVIAEVALVDFALCITGRACVPARLRLFGLLGD